MNIAMMPDAVMAAAKQNDANTAEALKAAQDAVKALVVLKGYGHYEVYTDPAFSEVMKATVAWFRQHLPPRTE